MQLTDMAIRALFPGALDGHVFHHAPRDPF
jgi:hypothetical protein